ncbi:MAG: ATP-binding protein [Spirochaetaceae bacterium]|jgi:predicted AAA+ superfamily ATPase|nr:ATP-binding protein [Spirochaetaceae bacterium]
MNEKNVIRKGYLNQLKAWLNTPLIKIITGMRRVGKSTLMEQWVNYLQREEGIHSRQILFIPCDSLENTELQHWKQLEEHISPLAKQTGPKYLLIDEIQHIEGWETLITALHREGSWDLYITGSNSDMLSGELATRLSGRYVQMQIFPFSYSEHLEILGIKEHQSEEFMKYLQFGGIPVLYHIYDEDSMKHQILEAVYNTIILKDIIERHKIRNVDLLERIVSYYMDNIGNISNAKKIADYCKSQRISVGVETVQNYMKYLETCFIMHRVRRNDLKGKRILEVNEKLFCNDTGLRNAVLRRKTQDIGALLENLVYLELLRRGYHITVGYYGEWEIDFVAEKGSQREYYQVSYLLASEETINREFRPLEAVDDNFPKYILSMDQIDLSRNGIIHRSIPRWLLDKAP